jgi:preprotein translocase subunit Sss1
MGGDLIGLVAVVLTCGLPVAALYTYYRVRKLRTEERLAALARGTEIPMEPELSQFARSRRAGILLVSGGVGFIVMFALIARIVGEPETLAAAAVGILPLAVGIGYFLDAALIHRDMKTT